LGKKGIEVDLLVTIDPYGLGYGDFNLKHGNVKKAINYYQKNKTTGLWGPFDPFGQNPYQGKRVNGANVTNTDYTGKTDPYGRMVTHLSLPQLVTGAVTSKVQSAISADSRFNQGCTGSPCGGSDWYGR
jgi:hypothetical protein